MHWKKKHRPIRILMNDNTFRTHLVDDSFSVREVIQEIIARFGPECAFDIEGLEKCKCGCYKVE